MASLQDLLSQEGFRFSLLPVSMEVVTELGGGGEARRSSCSGGSAPAPLLDLAATRAAISILSGPATRFRRDPEFRRRIRRICSSAASSVAGLAIWIDDAERLAVDPSKIRALRLSVHLLTLIASLSSGAGAGSISGVPKSHVAAVAQLYLAFVYRIDRNRRVAAAHTLRVFAEAPELARKKLLPGLWERLFLPHLLHLELWFSAAMSEAAGGEKERVIEMKKLRRVYNAMMDEGTTSLAIYYKMWIRVGGDAPAAIPPVPFPAATASMSGGGGGEGEELSGKELKGGGGVENRILFSISKDEGQNPAAVSEGCSKDEGQNPVCEVVFPQIKKSNLFSSIIGAVFHHRDTEKEAAGVPMSSSGSLCKRLSRLGRAVSSLRLLCFSSVLEVGDPSKED